MKRLAGVLSVVAVVAASSVASAGEFRGPLFPAPAVIGLDGHTEVKPVPEAGAVELFHCVKYRDLDHIAPCAEPKIVEVADPCWRPDPCNPCCKPKCVKVMICVPKQQCCNPAPTCCGPAPTCCDHGPKVTCNKDGKYVKYDYGKYRIELRVKDGLVEVDYDN